ncbi:hypothetical protein ACFL27_19055 [candidate division CSSED10-310 bacterium]|uniref:Uncharacterized protein n=1 Tax=candidate division CSSED10-310 bacterium TaxID=2855610 RepID=A0ABV6Z1U8_UNCC1
MKIKAGEQYNVGQFHPLPPPAGEKKQYILDYIDSPFRRDF